MSGGGFQRRSCRGTGGGVQRRSSRGWSGGVQRRSSCTCITRSGIEGILAHCRGPSDIHTGQKRAVRKGDRADGSHGGRKRYRGEGGAVGEGSITDGSHRSGDGY